MRKLSNWLLPPWAQPEHQLLQYELAHFRAGSRRRLLVQLALLSLLLGGSAIVYGSVNASPADSANLTSLIWRSLYFPILILQLLTLSLALLFGAAVVGEERSRKTWDNLRATEFGAGAVLRARWASILYRLRAPIMLILLARCVFIAGLLYDLTAFGGYYPEMLGAQATPPLPIWRLDLLLIALSVTVALLLPLTAIAFVSAFGILLSVAVRERIYALIIQLIAVAALVLFAGAGAFAIAQMIQSDAADWHLALMFSYIGLGDWGLLLAHLGSLGEIWQRLPYGWTISAGLMLLALAQGLAADGLMWLAARLSERRG
ncbi:MAG: hypothetical protein OXG85_12535 [Chloroflexi bacterium]|nr:hypothetical protein [Chloroflexota bacterium]